MHILSQKATAVKVKRDRLREHNRIERTGTIPMRLRGRALSPHSVRCISSQLAHMCKPALLHRQA